MHKLFEKYLFAYLYASVPYERTTTIEDTIDTIREITYITSEISSFYKNTCETLNRVRMSLIKTLKVNHRIDRIHFILKIKVARKELDRLLVKI